MEEKTVVAKVGQLKEIDQEVLRAVYALNMCTVSVSQIIDYNDVYILEQEYDAILNNLNLERMPKADALKNILVELLNTITFFRIQEIRKEAIEKNYQKRVKNAIWSAIPNLNLIVAGSAAAIACSVATQVGIGYMNYRKEKANALTEKEKEELELRITAIEQFNALRRELFTTAWELAEEYKFNDRLRLTEKQIKQYNQILMDQDELRKYVRLEAIKDKFEAFPPFWYFFGHTACYIAGDKTLPLEEWERDLYRKNAKEHFKHYEELNKFNILREDQLTCSFALEYVDLLLLEDKPDKKKINELIAIAEDMSGNALDIKEMCMIAYLKIGGTRKAAELLRQLVNEDYNTIMNAKILSRIYVSEFLTGSSPTAKLDYKTLVLRLGDDKIDYLFPMPKNKIKDVKLEEAYLANQKVVLQTEYRKAVNQLFHKYTVLYNAIIPVPKQYDYFEEYYGCTESARNNREKDIKDILGDESKRDDFLDEVKNNDFLHKVIDLLNEVIDAFNDLKIWKESKVAENSVSSVRNNIIENSSAFNDIKEKMKTREFSVDDYNKLQDTLSIKTIMGEMVDKLKDTIMDAVEKMDSLEKIENAEYDLVDFCHKHEIVLLDIYEKTESKIQETQAYLDYEIFGESIEDERRRIDRYNKMKELVNETASKLIIGDSKVVSVLLPESDNFKTYFKNEKLKVPDSLKGKTFAIIEDHTWKDCDLLLTQDGVLLIYNNKYNKKYCYEYDNIKYQSDSWWGKILKLGKFEEYTNKNVDVQKLHNLIIKLQEA